MLQEIVLQNFQSHRKTTLQLHEGVNTICGSSDNGKTAILRALYWTIYNRPSGLSYISHWNRDKNNKPIKSTFVRLTTDKGIVERRRGKIKVEEDSKEFNGYIVNDNNLEAIGQEVPDEVSKFLNLDSVNIQRQMDAPFLLSESAGEVARFFNSVIRLDIIDRVISKAESKRRELNKDKNRTEEEIKSIEKEIAELDWLDEAEKLVDNILEIDNKIKNDEEIQDRLVSLLDDYADCIDVITNQELILSAIPIVNKIAAQIESIEKKIRIQDRIKTLCEEWKEQNSIIGMADFSKAEKVIEQIDEINENIEAKEKMLKDMQNSLEEWYFNYDTIKLMNINITELEKELPSMCPTCGKKLVEDKCK